MPSIDTRDSRLDIGFILGDDDVPDSTHWSINERDTSCIWLGMIDFTFNKCDIVRSSEMSSNDMNVESANDTVGLMLSGDVVVSCETPCIEALGAISTDVEPIIAGSAYNLTTVTKTSSASVSLNTIKKPTISAKTSTNVMDAESTKQGSVDIKRNMNVVNVVSTSSRRARGRK